MAKRSMFVGMNVHKESIDVSLAEEGRDGEVRRYGVIPGDLEVRREHHGQDPVDPFIDPEGYRAFIAGAEAELRQGRVH